MLRLLVPATLLLSACSGKPESLSQSTVAHDCMQEYAAERASEPDIQVLRPATFIEGERYAQSIAASGDTGLVFSTLATIGAIDIHLWNDTRWMPLDRIKLPGQSVSNTRQLMLATSADGETLAVFANDPSSDNRNELYVLERLGESWIITDSWPVTGTCSANHAYSEMQSELGSRNAWQLKISDNSDRILAGCVRDLVVYTREQLHWSATATSDHLRNRDVSQFAVNDAIDRIAFLERTADVLQLYTLELSEGSWRALAMKQIKPLPATDVIHMVANGKADQIIIASWDYPNAVPRRALARLYQSQADGSLRLLKTFCSPPAQSETAELRFASDRYLQSLTVGWQNIPGSEASLSTFSYQPDTDQWFKQWQLPQLMSEITTEAFADRLSYSPNGKALFISNDRKQASGPLNRVGEVLSIRRP
ncbi:MAG: hypothetical protein AB8B63_07100 [Granulosicoccus sp.]